MAPAVEQAWALAASQGLFVAAWVVAAAAFEQLKLLLTVR